MHSQKKYFQMFEPEEAEPKNNYHRHKRVEGKKAPLVEIFLELYMH